MSICNKELPSVVQEVIPTRQEEGKVVETKEIIERDIQEIIEEESRGEKRWPNRNEVEVENSNEVDDSLRKNFPRQKAIRQNEQSKVVSDRRHFRP